MFSEWCKLHTENKQGSRYGKLNYSNEYGKVRQWHKSPAIVESLQTALKKWLCSTIPCIF